MSGESGLLSGGALRSDGVSSLALAEEKESRPQGPRSPFSSSGERERERERKVKRTPAQMENVLLLFLL